jgi:5-methylcytosine-specific restriction protein A
MTALPRACLGCGRRVRGRSRCKTCTALRERATKTARRPERRTYSEQQRRARTVADWRIQVGDWCPGYERPAHQAAHLQADHVVEVSAGGSEDGPLQVLCSSCNNAKARATFARMMGVSPLATTPSPPAPPKFATLSGDAAPGPVAG